MKIRNGFVSNSSSSSYIVAFDGLTRPDLEKLFVSGSYSGDNTSVDAVGVQDVVSSMKSWYEIGENTGQPWAKEGEMNKYHYDQFIYFAGVVSKISKAIDNGDDVALVCVSYGDDVSYDNLTANGIRIIESFG